MYSNHEGYNDSIHGYYLEDLKVGMSASHAKTVTETDVVMFAGLTGDNNPVHCNEVFAAQTQFKTRIAHGMLVAGLLSTVMGSKLPGPGTIYLKQELSFLGSVRIGDTVTARVEVLEVMRDRNLVRLKTTCLNQQGKAVIDGEAVVIPSAGI